MRNAGRFVFLVIAICASDLVLGSFLSSEGFADEHFGNVTDQVCVTLEKQGSGCNGHVQSTNVFTALTRPGSPCKHTVNMKDNSAKDQYCDSHGAFHQTVFIDNKQCKVGWEQKAYSPMKLTYTQDKCTYGYKLKSCTPGPCEDSRNSNELMDADEFIESVGRQLRRNLEG